MSRADEIRAQIEALEAELTALEGASSRSPLAPADFPDLPVIDGVRLAAAEAGVRYQGRLDVMLAEICEGAAIAGVFTRSATRAAPVILSQAALQQHATSTVRGKSAFLVNSGNANAFTGRAGDESVETLIKELASTLNCPAENIYTASTGVIGERLPHERIAQILGGLCNDLAPGNYADAARAIMTTDTFPKASTVSLQLDGVPVNIVGIAKGSGMIAPDMATMLVYIFTDANIEQSALQELLGSLTETSFNAITVDSDTSTSDTLMLAATKRAQHQPITAPDSALAAPFKQALSDVMRDLAQQVVRDGEGASKFVEIEVTGATSDQSAMIVGKAIANSPLVKTAIAGEDPNWGRIIAAIGKAGEAADRDAITIRFGDHLVAEKGWVAPDYREEVGAAYMKQSKINIGVDLGVGTGHAVIWTCDLTHQYITINADYRS